MKKTIRDFDLNEKKVIIRCDFNVPVKDGTITDDNRIKASLETINYALEHNAKVILMSHMGRIKEEADLNKNTLRPVAIRLSELLPDREVTFVPTNYGEIVNHTIDMMRSGDIVLLENTRYQDLNGKAESTNNPELGSYWASLGDIFINDAFATAHRAHASNAGIAANLPSGIGLLMEKELNTLGGLLESPERPFTVILGGAKVSDKIGVIKNLVTKADNILIGGGMAYTFFKAQGLNVGTSLVDDENIAFCQEMLTTYPNKIILPIDNVVADNLDNPTNVVVTEDANIPEGMMGLDIGPKTVEKFNTYISSSKTIFWNGPVGVFENERFAEGTKKLCETIANTQCTSVIGGGDTGSAIQSLGFADKVSYISTGGGASLELLEGKELPGVTCINNK
jgi:phosphoglycerate kinase